LTLKNLFLMLYYQPTLCMCNNEIFWSDWFFCNRVYNIGIETKPGKGQFRHTSIVTLSPRYHVDNMSEHKLAVAQRHFTNKEVCYVNFGSMLQKTSGDISKFMNSWFHLHEFMISTSWSHYFNFMKSWFQLHEFTISTSRLIFWTSRFKLREFVIATSQIHYFYVFCMLKLWIHEFEIMNSWRRTREFRKWKCHHWSLYKAAVIACK
jgi:hypothetical protein